MFLKAVYGIVLKQLVYFISYMHYLIKPRKLVPNKL
jgi:hypothetical protein